MVDFPEYQISDQGRFKKPTGEIVLGCDVQGYRMASMSYTNRLGHRASKNRGVHLLVLEAFVGPRPEGLICCHINDVRHDNRLENLKWGTYKENSEDAQRNGRIRKLTPDEVRHFRTSTKNDEELAAEFNVSAMTVFNVRWRQSYRKVL